MKPDFNQQADKLIVDGRYDKAQKLLRKALGSMPKGWRPQRDDGRFLTIAFWDQEEFLAHSLYAMKRSGGLTKSISWINQSYSRAWYQLAVAASKQKAFEEALFSIGCGLELENDHPELWSEKGYLLGQLKRHQEALECYVRADVREWAPKRQVARALRGQGVQLIDLDRLDEAETVLRKSLVLEPKSELARHELEYIEKLRAEREARRQQLPWFVHAHLNPPTDPLTVRLLALVNGHA